MDKELTGRVDQHGQDIDYILGELRRLREWKAQFKTRPVDDPTTIFTDSPVTFGDLVKDFEARHDFIPAVPEVVTPAKPSEWKPLRPAHWDYQKR